MEISSILTLFALAFFLPQAFISTDTSAGTADVTLSVATNLTFALSSHNLTISNLAPGAVANSNVITISTNTNNSTGYTLAATVGDASHNTTSLIRSSTADAFEGLATDSSLAMNNIPDSKWGFSSDSGLTFSGLPLYTDTPKILDLSSLPVAGGTINFSIAAHAPSDMSAGTYENVITFSVVANYDTMTLSDAYALAGRTPVSTASGSYYTMQDMSMDICNNVDTLNSSLQLLDTRDNKLYWVTKLADGNCWMTQNLDYDIAGDSSDIYSGLDGSAITLMGNNNAYSTYNFDGIEDLGSFSNASDRICFFGPSLSSSKQGGCSFNVGNYYAANGTSTTPLPISCNTTTNDGENCHYHLGNYYTSNATTVTDLIDSGMEASICPQHWALPQQSLYSSLYSLLGSNISTAPASYFNFVGKVHDSVTMTETSPVLSLASSGYGSEADIITIDGGFIKLDSSSLTLETSSDEKTAYSVRCIASAPVPLVEIQLTFDLQGGSVSSGLDTMTQVVMEGKQATFTFPTKASNIPTKSSYKFLGWDTNPNASTPTYVLSSSTYSGGGGGGGLGPLNPTAGGDLGGGSIVIYSYSPSSITTNESITLYAIWKYNECTNCSTS